MHVVSLERSTALELLSQTKRATAPKIAVEARPDKTVATELNRWALFLVLPFVLSAGFFMAAISTGHEWLIGGTLITGPGLLIMAFIYLSISSDTNGDQ